VRRHAADPPRAHASCHREFAAWQARSSPRGCVEIRNQNAQIAPMQRRGGRSRMLPMTFPIAG